MNLYLDIPSPAAKIASENASRFGILNHGLTNPHRVYWNLTTPALYEEAIFRGEGVMAEGGPFIVHTGKHTARAAADKFIVQEQTTGENIWWGQYNRPFSPDKFSVLATRLQGYLQGRDIFVQDLFAGSDEEERLAIRVITEYASHALFARTLFSKPRSREEMSRHVPEFTIICAPGFKGSPIVDSTRSETFIIANFAERLAIIGNTAYGGEIKKTVFTVLNYLLPLNGVLPMHCSANVGDEDDVAIFFGLSGTGKTTLSAEPSRHLIGDDEHGWSENGVFNFEDGCYAKVIRLSEDAEPQIYACTKKFGTILENVAYDPVSRMLDLNDQSITENTRAAYPLSYIDNYWPPKRAGHPKNVIFLTCDATGVMPPISRLNPDQATYHFISGYTSKIAGTEIGLGIEPELTFSPCFGGVFMVHHPYKYAEMLKSKILKHGARCWLVNTGWTGGPFGVGKRFSIQHTRALLHNALNGKLNNVKFRRDPV
ncbi:MAG: phosphoenolpyruvate carboxykinase (ATP), partial [bacterium]